MIRVLGLCLLTAFPALAQTRTEVAANNIHLAMGLCVQNYRQPETVVDAFKQAGFAYAPEDFGGGEVLHGFSDPSQTVQITVAIEGMQVECRIGTGEWGVEQMVPFALDTFRKLAPSVQIHEGGAEGETVLPGTPAAQNGACTGFFALLPRVALVTQVMRQGNDGTCQSDGTSVLRMMF